MMSILFVTLVATLTAIVNGQSSCVTPDGANGTCTLLYNCKPLLNIANKRFRTKEQNQLLTDSYCDRTRKNRYVCCPSVKKCTTPEGDPGTCTDVSSCPHVLDLLNKRDRRYAKYICDSDENSVCCKSVRNPRPTNRPQQATRPPPTTTSKPKRKIDCAQTIGIPDHDSYCCGYEANADNKIIGGSATKIDQYPWLALLESEIYNRMTRMYKMKLICGGSLISQKFVVTAGHCVKGDQGAVGTPKNVHLGEHDTSNALDEPDCSQIAGGGTVCNNAVVVIAIEKAIPHPDYDPTNTIRRWHDIALLKLARAAPYTEFIRPICLPNWDTFLNNTEITMIVAGWGRTTRNAPASAIKLAVKLPYRSKQRCQKAYSKDSSTLELGSGQVCAGGQRGKDSCKGDSGGPLMYESNTKFDLLGIVSFGASDCGAPGVPGVYTKVRYYVPWIREEIEKESS